MSNVCEISKSPSTLFGGASFGGMESVKFEMTWFLPESRFECVNSVERPEPFDPIGEIQELRKKTRVQQNSTYNGGTLSECTPHLRHLSLASTDVQA
jgi:hypothetical protein